MSRMFRILVFFSAAVAIVLCAIFALRKGQAPRAVKYSQFIKLLKEGRVTEVTIDSSGTKLVGTYKNPRPGTPTKFYAYFRSNMKPSPEKEVIDQGVALNVKEAAGSKWWDPFLVPLLYVLLLFGIFILIVRQAQSSGGQAFHFGRSKHKLVSENRAKVCFDDVAGVEEAKQELSEVVDYLKYPKKYQKLGARIPKGVLLIGAPGTGKTLLGRAVAGEAGVPFYYISGSDFVEMFVGVGASRVRDLFDQAKKTAPCIVFVDEIDAVGRQRGAGLGGGHDEREQTLNQLLVEMDGFEANQNVIVLAATNRPDVLDPALLRPGRFDRRVVVDQPDIAGRLAILKVHSRGKPLSKEVELGILARRTPGFSGADLESLLNEAALQAARAGREKVTMPDCEEAIDRVRLGPERKSRIIPEKEREVTAYHEAGHAMVARALPDADPVRKVTILPRGMTLGITSLIPEEDRYSHTREEMVARICVFMGGRAAEDLVFNEITTGASNDIERATELARDMICRYGMSRLLGPVNFAGSHSQVFLGRDLHETRNFSESIAQQIDAEVHSLIQTEYDRAKEILGQQRDKLDEFAAELIANEVLEEEDLDRLLGPSMRQQRQQAAAARQQEQSPPAVVEPQQTSPASAKREKKPLLGPSPNPEPI